MIDRSLDLDANEALGVGICTFCRGRRGFRFTRVKGLRGRVARGRKDRHLHFSILPIALFAS